MADLIYYYGEERYSRRIARAVVERRREKPIRTAAELAELVRRCVPRSPKGRQIDPATRTFQALRIAVNDELKSLEIALRRMPDCLRPGGRLAVISFHSLEDRRVKEAFRDDPRLKTLTVKPIRPGEEETARNPRASAPNCAWPNERHIIIFRQGGPRMGKEAKIGLAVILVLLITFGVVLGKRLSDAKNQPLSASSEQKDKSDAGSGTTDLMPKSSTTFASSGKATVVASKPALTATTARAPDSSSQWNVVSDNRTSSAGTRRRRPPTCPTRPRPPRRIPCRVTHRRPNIRRRRR